MKKNFTLIFAMLFILFYTRAKAQTQFWSDTFEDTNAPSAGTRSSSYNTGGPSSPYSYYFLRTDGTNIALQAFSSPETTNSYQGKEGTKFWAGEDLDRVGTGANNAADKIQNITWTGINITGKSGLTFKGLFAANSGHDWQDITAFPATYDFMEVEYRINNGAWTLAGGIYPESSASGGFAQKRLRVDTGTILDKVGDGEYISRTFKEIEWNITGTGNTLDLRFRVSADAGTTQEFAIDNFRLFEAPTNAAPTDLSLSATTINENVAAGSTVGILSSVDVDLGNTFTYSLVSGTGSTDNAAFSISGANLQIVASPDFETKSSYAIRLRTADQLGLSFEKTFTINVNNLNEIPTDLALSATAINENVAGGTTVGVLSSVDADAANTFTYTLVAGAGSTDNSAFIISGANLQIVASPDFETKSS
ncbi:cadherin repeat domain-containing protein, partial [Flavobacterium hydrophilum]